MDRYFPGLLVEMHVVKVQTGAPGVNPHPLYTTFIIGEIGKASIDVVASKKGSREPGDRENKCQTQQDGFDNQPDTRTSKPQP